MKKYYSIDKILNPNTKFNLIILPRGYGRTYYMWKLYCKKYKYIEFEEFCEKVKERRKNNETYCIS